MLSTSDGSPLSFGNCLKPCYRIRTTRQLAIYLLLTCLQRRVPLPLSCFHPMLASMPLFILAYEYPLVYFPAAYHHRGKWPPPVLTTALPRSTYPHVHVHHTPTVGVSASPNHRGELGRKQTRSPSRSYGLRRRYVRFTGQPVIIDLPASPPQNPSSAPAPIRGRLPCISRTLSYPRPSPVAPDRHGTPSVSVTRTHKVLSLPFRDHDRRRHLRSPRPSRVLPARPVGSPPQREAALPPQTRTPLLRARVLRQAPETVAHAALPPVPPHRPRVERDGQGCELREASERRRRTPRDQHEDARAVGVQGRARGRLVLCGCGRGAGIRRGCTATMSCGTSTCTIRIMGRGCCLRG